MSLSRFILALTFAASLSGCGYRWVTPDGPGLASSVRFGHIEDLSPGGRLGDRLRTALRVELGADVQVAPAEERTIPELVGRMPVVATLAELSEDALMQILTKPKNALVKQFSKLFGMEGVELEIRPAALKAVAKKALARKTGARGLRSILEQALINTMFDLPDLKNVEKVVVEESTIDEQKPPLMVYREAAKKA